MSAFSSALYCSLEPEQDAAALRQLKPILEATGAELTIMGCVEEPSGLQRMFKRSGQVDQIVEAARGAERERLERFAKRVHLDDADVRVDSGTAAIAIIHQVLRAEHDLVVVGAGVETPHKATIKRLLRKCPAPVWVIRPSRARKPRVMAAVNPEPAELDLNLDIMATAATMHELVGGELHVVHAWELYGEDSLRYSAFMHLPEDDVEKMLAQELEGRTQALDELVASPSIARWPWRKHLRKGRPAVAVVDAVADQKINLLVLGTVARGGIPGLVMGNTAETILDKVTCSVLALKPDGFVSPIAHPNDG